MRKQEALKWLEGAVNDAFMDLFYYDRKGDEEMGVNKLRQLMGNGTISSDDMMCIFAKKIKDEYSECEEIEVHKEMISGSKRCACDDCGNSESKDFSPCCSLDCWHDKFEIEPPKHISDWAQEFESNRIIIKFGPIEKPDIPF